LFRIEQLALIARGFAEDSRVWSARGLAKLRLVSIFEAATPPQKSVIPDRRRFMDLILNNRPSSSVQN
jgi:hypothetical protein